MTLKLILTFLVDAIVVLGFAATGRNTHQISGTTADTVATAAPFLLALVIAWGILLVRSARGPGHASSQPWSMTSGVIVWLVTAAAGLGLRVLMGGTAATPFIFVTLSVLGTGLLGWRLIAWIVRAVRSRGAPSADANEGNPEPGSQAETGTSASGVSG